MSELMKLRQGAGFRLSVATRGAKASRHFTATALTLLSAARHYQPIPELEPIRDFLLSSRVSDGGWPARRPAEETGEPPVSDDWETAQMALAVAESFEGGAGRLPDETARRLWVGCHRLTGAQAHVFAVCARALMAAGLGREARPFLHRLSDIELPPMTWPTWPLFWSQIHPPQRAVSHGRQSIMQTRAVVGRALSDGGVAPGLVESLAQATAKQLLSPYGQGARPLYEVAAAVDLLAMGASLGGGETGATVAVTGQGFERVLKAEADGGAEPVTLIEGVDGELEITIAPVSGGAATVELIAHWEVSPGQTELTTGLGLTQGCEPVDGAEAAQACQLTVSAASPVRGVLVEVPLGVGQTINVAELLASPAEEIHHLSADAHHLWVELDALGSAAVTLPFELGGVAKPVAKPVAWLAELPEVVTIAR